MKRLDQLTFTRFIAILTVLFFHGGGGVYLQALAAVFPFRAILTSAETSVTYLYALSGFVMSLAYYRPREKFSISSYWTARFVRLYPLYIISFLMICYYYLDSVYRIKPQKILTNVFALQAWWPPYAQSFNYPSWSITVEFFFYAVFPFFAWWAYRQSTKKLIWVSLIIWTVSQTLHNALWIGYFPERENFLVYFPPFHLSSFILGAVGGIWFLREGRERETNPNVALLVFVGGVILTSVYVVILNSWSVNAPHGVQLMTGLLAPILTVVIAALAVDKTSFSAFLNHPALIALGEMSYALYILHIPVKWIYERALENSSLVNYRTIFDYTYLPLMIAVGALAHFYIDPPLRNGLKKILQRVSAPLLLLDFVIISASVYISFRLRFGSGREYDSYRSAILLTFWSAFILRTISSVVFNALNPSILHGSFQQLVRPVLVSISVSSAFIFGIIFSGYSLGWFDNFPRSVFAIDWALVFGLSLLTRFIFRYFRAYQPEPLPA